MSKSRRKTPIIGITTATSEAIGKRLWHKRARAMVRERIHHSDDPLTVLDNEAGNVWAMEKDGRQWIGDRLTTELRK